MRFPFSNVRSIPDYAISLTFSVNTLFSDGSRSATSGCYATSRTKEVFVQISSAWNSREGAPLGRNRYLELQIKKEGQMTNAPSCRRSKSLATR
jgi:hypothetical protein